MRFGVKNGKKNFRPSENYRVPSRTWQANSENGFGIASKSWESTFKILSKSHGRFWRYSIWKFFPSSTVGSFEGVFERLPPYIIGIFFTSKFCSNVGASGVVGTNRRPRTVFVARRILCHFCAFLPLFDVGRWSEICADFAFVSYFFQTNKTP